MCECGCSGGNFTWRMPAPDGRWYVLGVYDSCQDCDTPAGVDISLASPSDMKDYRYDRLPILDTSVAMLGIAVLHPRQLKERIMKGAEGDAEVYEELVDDIIDDSFRDAVNDTGKEFGPATIRKRKRKAANPAPPTEHEGEGPASEEK